LLRHQNDRHISSNINTNKKALYNTNKKVTTLATALRYIASTVKLKNTSIWSDSMMPPDSLISAKVLAPPFGSTSTSVIVV
jgi:hypothetical protein